MRVDHALAARDIMLLGRGIALAHVWLIDDLFAAGVIERVLPDHNPAPVPLTMLNPPVRAWIQRVRAITDALVQALRTLQGIG